MGKNVDNWGKVTDTYSMYVSRFVIPLLAVSASAGVMARPAKGEDRSVAQASPATVRAELPERLRELDSRERGLAQILLDHQEYGAHFENSNILDGRAYEAGAT